MCCSLHSSLLYPGVAQLVAHVVWDHGVVGSSPTTRTRKFTSYIKPKDKENSYVDC